MSNHKGRRTRWFKRSTPPARPGVYECGVKITNAQRTLMKWDLEWDGVGFLVPVPMMVFQWRGLARKPRGAKGALTK